MALEENSINTNLDNADEVRQEKKDLVLSGKTRKKTATVKKTAKKKTTIKVSAKKSPAKKKNASIAPVKTNVIPAQPMALPPGDEDIDLGKPTYFNAAREELKKELSDADFNEVSGKKASQPSPIKIKTTPENLEEKKYFDIKPKTDSVNTVHNEYVPKTMKTIINKSAAEQAPPETQKHSLKLYRNIALLFIFATTILAAVIGYFSFIRVKITLIPNQENISNNLIFDIYDIDKEASTSSNSTIVGVVKKINVKLEKNYPATGEKVVGKEVAGEVTIINNYEKNQPLVATTRLLSADGKLFRIKETVNVPAGGSIKVAVFADQPSEEMAIGPTKFTIPGLWAGLQEEIYAQSDQVFSYQQKVEKSIVSEDIENSKVNIKQAILEKAGEMVNNDYNEYKKIIYNIDEASISSKIDGEVGDKKDEFLVSASADVVVVGFNEDKTESSAKSKFILSLPDNKELLSFNEGGIVYSLNSSDVDKGIATVNATFDGKVTLKDGANIVDVNKILGLNKEQLNAYLSSIPDLAGFEVKFTPSWLWKVPQFIEPSKIQLEVKK